MVKIFLSNLCGVGDLIRMEPLIRGLRKKYEDAYILVLTREGRESVFKRHQAVDDVLSLKIQNCNDRSQRGDNPVEIIRDEIYMPILFLRQMQFDIAVVPPHQSDSIINGLIKAKEYYGAYSFHFEKEIIRGDGARRFDALMKMEPLKRQEEKNINFTDLMLDICRELDLPILKEERAPEFYIGPSERSYAVCVLKKGIGQKKNRLIVLNLTARGKERQWSAAKTANLADNCIEEFGAKILFDGTNEDHRTFIRPVLSMMRFHDQVIVPEGKTSLSEYAALIERADLLITSDSAPMHLGDCLGVPMIVLMDIARAEEAKPYRKNSRLIKKYRMSDIGVEEVLGEIRNVFEK